MKSIGQCDSCAKAAQWVVTGEGLEKPGYLCDDCRAEHVNTVEGSTCISLHASVHQAVGHFCSGGTLETVGGSPRPILFVLNVDRDETPADNTWQHDLMAFFRDVLNVPVAILWRGYTLETVSLDDATLAYLDRIRENKPATSPEPV